MSGESRIYHILAKNLKVYLIFYVGESLKYFFSLRVCWGCFLLKLRCCYQSRWQVYCDARFCRCTYTVVVWLLAWRVKIIVNKNICTYRSHIVAHLLLPPVQWFPVFVAVLSLTVPRHSHPLVRLVRIQWRQVRKNQRGGSYEKGMRWGRGEKLLLTDWSCTAHHLLFFFFLS